jgi:hypothetical protein
MIIALADVAMSLDNVLAIAAAAAGNVSLMVIGVALSLPLVVWGEPRFSPGSLTGRYGWSGQAQAFLDVWPEKWHLAI